MAEHIPHLHCAQATTAAAEQDPNCLLPARLHAGEIVVVMGIKSKPTLNGRLGSLANSRGNRWAVLVAGLGQQVSLKPENLKQPRQGTTTVPAAVSLSAAQESSLVDVELLAELVMWDFVEGKEAYPVFRKLARAVADGDSERLFPGPSSGRRELPATWSDLEPSESHRLFYKMALCGRCSELVYTFAECANMIADVRTLTFKDAQLAGMFICVGFVTHAYRRLKLEGDFGANYWQFSTKVHNQAKNHAWLEFPLPGASPHDQSKRMILDLAAQQYDMRMPTGNVQIIPGQDERYRKSYELPFTSAPIHFLMWACQRNNVNFDGRHLAETIQRLRPRLGISSSTSLVSLTAARDLLTEWARMGLPPGMLLQLAQDSPEVDALGVACGISLGSLLRMDQDAASEMRATLGAGPSHEAGGPACAQQ